MGELREPCKVKLFAGMLVSGPEHMPHVKKDLIAMFGPADAESPVWDFVWTDYYAEESGTAIKRAFISFDKLIEPERLPEIKLATNALEAKYASAQTRFKRPVNIDPGYLESGKLILATTKNHAHRVYLSQGIFAEVTLTYTGGRFADSPWTYPDYKTPQYKEFFTIARGIYLKQL